LHADELLVQFGQERVVQPVVGGRLDHGLRRWLHRGRGRRPRAEQRVLGHAYAASCNRPIGGWRVATMDALFEQASDFGWCVAGVTVGTACVGIQCDVF
jgi:hypothetical protein